MRQKEEEGIDVYYLDEAGSNIGDVSPYGRSYQGLDAFSSKKASKGERISVIAILSKEGIEQPFCYEGTLDGDFFLYYTEEFLLPFLKKGSVLVMDNAKPHHNIEAWNILFEHGIEVRFQPQYSPDMNPIEMAWSKMKGFIKKQYTKTKKELYSAIAKAIKTITNANAKAYIKKCLYRNLLKPQPL